MKTETHAPDAPFAGWQKLVATYQKPDVRKSIWQIVNSFGGYLLGWVLLAVSLQVGYWLTLLLAIPIAGFLMRIFIIQHDCGHGSFFRSRRANDLTGVICGMFTLVPYKYWRRSHAIHHAHHADLEERGTGDIWTLTIDEYMQAPRWKRIAYRVFRNPLFLFGIAPTINFLIIWRFPLDWQTTDTHYERRSFLWNNLAIACWVTLASAFIGFGSTMMILIPLVAIASSIGTWLFYVQHQFERTYWEHTPQWDYTLAAMAGSSYYKLPRVLQWFTGNIGFHHIHHLSPRIPNYHLERCHVENPMFQQVVQLTIIDSLQTMSLTLWDEERRRLVTFREALESRLATAQAT